MDVLESSIFRVVILGVVLVGWWVLHRLHQQSFLLYQWSRLHDSLVRLDRTKSAEINADLAREVRESKHFIPYVFAIRQFNEAPGLEETKNQAALTIDTINERLHPREVLRIRGEEIRQDLEAEIPRFKRQMDQLYSEQNHRQWIAASAEISRIRAAIIATQVELRNNPELESEFSHILNLFDRFHSFMDNARLTGSVPDSEFGRIKDELLTNTFNKRAQQRYGSPVA